MTQAPGGEPYSPEMLERCDPGIREVVRLLNEAGFCTTDSGDGSKRGAVMPYRHVAMSCLPGELLREARRAWDVLRASGHGAGMHIQASFDPADNSVAILATWA